MFNNILEHFVNVFIKQIIDFSNYLLKAMLCLVLSMLEWQLSVDTCLKINVTATQVLAQNTKQTQAHSMPARPLPAVQAEVASVLCFSS